MTTPDSEVEKMAQELFQVTHPNQEALEIAQIVLALQEAKRREVIKECAETLAVAVSVIEGLSEQQAWYDGHYEAPLAKIKAVLAKLEQK